MFYSWFWYGMSVSHEQEQTRAFKRAIDLQYTHAPECHFQLGKKFAAAGNHQEAIRAYRTSLQGNPYRTVCHISLGFSLFHIGQIQEAKSCFEKAVDLNPVLNAANLGLANVYTKEGNKQRRRNILTSGINPREMRSNQRAQQLSKVTQRTCIKQVVTQCTVMELKASRISWLTLTFYREKQPSMELESLRLTHHLMNLVLLYKKHSVKKENLVSVMVNMVQITVILLVQRTGKQLHKRPI